MKRLTDEEAAVVAAQIRAYDRVPKVRDGYLPMDEAEVRRILRRRHVAAAVKEGLRQRIETDLAPAAINFLDTVWRDTSIGMRERLAAATKIVDIGIVHRDRIEAKAGREPTDPAEMTEAQLREFLEATEGELAERAKLITPENVDEPPGPAHPLRSLAGQARPKVSRKVRTKSKIFE